MLSQGNLKTQLKMSLILFVPFSPDLRLCYVVGGGGGQERKAVSAVGVGDGSLSSGCLCPARHRGVVSGSRVCGWVDTGA